MFKPDTLNLNTPVGIQLRVITDVNGAADITYHDADPPLDYCNWKGRGGTESTASGSLVVEDTATVIMWYRPDITEQTRLLLNGNPDMSYEVVNVEDVEQRHMWLILKVKRAVNA